MVLVVVVVVDMEVVGVRLIVVVMGVVVPVRHLRGMGHTLVERVHPPMVVVYPTTVCCPWVFHHY